MIEQIKRPFFPVSMSLFYRNDDEAAKLKIGLFNVVTKEHETREYDYPVIIEGKFVIPEDDIHNFKDYSGKIHTAIVLMRNALSCWNTADRYNSIREEFRKNREFHKGPVLDEMKKLGAELGFSLDIVTYPALLEKLFTDEAVTISVDDHGEGCITTACGGKFIIHPNNMCEAVFGMNTGVSSTITATDEWVRSNTGGSVTAPVLFAKHAAASMKNDVGDDFRFDNAAWIRNRIKESNPVLYKKIIDSLVDLSFPAIE